jgi:sulfur carrier protein
MTITVAGNKKEVEAGITVKELIEQEQIESPQYVTVTVNDEFLKSEEIPTKVLAEGDSVEFLYFMGGGAR